jgi:predicted ester cyclase
MSGTHQGKIMGIPATGQKISVQGVSIMEIEDGLIARGNNVWDTAGFLRAMRLLPEL